MILENEKTCNRDLKLQVFVEIAVLGLLIFS